MMWNDGTPIPINESDMKTEGSQPAASDSPHKDESFTRETLPGAVGDLSGWDDQALRTGMGAECAALRTLAVPYPGRYHRLGTFIIESVKRFGDEDVKQLLRQEGIDSTRAWRAEQIATLYTFDQAAAFPSLRAILGTLPSKQPRKPKPQAGLTGGGGHQTAAPQEPPHVPSPAADDENILDRFVRLGIEVRGLLGDEAFDNAVERIKTYAPETFEQAFVEV